MSILLPFPIKYLFLMCSCQTLSFYNKGNIDYSINKGLLYIHGPESGFFYVKILVWYQIRVWTGSGQNFDFSFEIKKFEETENWIRKIQKKKNEKLEKIENLKK